MRREKENTAVSQGNITYPHYCTTLLHSTPFVNAIAYYLVQ